ncbi:MAG: Holliday junction branch migration DNA helicase RuvB [Planctomycetia bacterium]|nr:Holliday junction branch migration DNA helicase RuvB [Planctomycetia bacterium]
MAREAIVTAQPEPAPEYDAALRPRLLSEVIGQKAIVKRLGILLKAAKKFREPLQHMLFDGPPGLGKTTFATVLPNELGTTVQMTSGPALSKPNDLMPFLTNATEGSVLFIDEIHRMPRVVEEFIYPAMEDFRVDIVLGEGVNARTISMPLQRFTLIGATTRSGMLSGPMRDRFKTHEHLEFYSVDELAQIIRVNARKLQTPITEEASVELARRSRGTPRIANNRMWWTRSYAASEADGAITLPLAREALDMAEVDREGLDRQDRKYLETLTGIFNGEPTGVEAIAATMNIASDTLSNEIEPYLLREQFIIRSPRGRVPTLKSYQLLGRMPRKEKTEPQGSLFTE